MKSNREGLSITEVIVSSFLLALAVVSVAALTQFGARQERRAEQLKVCSQLASSYLAKTREWAQTTPQFQNWTGMEGTFEEAEYPGYTIEVRQFSHPLASICSQLEALHPGPEQRQLLTSSLRLEVEAKGGSESVTLTSLVGPPRDREFASITLASTGLVNPLPRLGEVEFQAQALDTDNQILNDVTFLWSVEAISSTGRIKNQTRWGSSAVFVHHFRVDPALPAPGDIFGPAGNCRVVVEGRYRGISRRAFQELVLSAS